MRILRYALISEGNSDKYTLEIICDRLASLVRKRVSIVNDLSLPINGSITKLAIKLRLELMDNEDVDFGVCLSDVDKGNYNEKIARLSSWIEGSNTRWYENFVIGAPDRNLEAWLLADENCVKNILGLDGSSPIPFGEEVDPKKRLTRLANEFGPESITPQQLHTQIASDMDIEIVRRRNNSFNKFADNFLRIIGLF